MSTGAEHYREAERLTRRADDQPRDAAALTFAEAQVHATLALTAATAQAGGLAAGGSHPTDWHRVLHGEETRS